MRTRSGKRRIHSAMTRIAPRPPTNTEVTASDAAATRPARNSPSVPDVPVQARDGGELLGQQGLLEDRRRPMLALVQVGVVDGQPRPSTQVSSQRQVVLVEATFGARRAQRERSQDVTAGAVILQQARQDASGLSSVAEQAFRRIRRCFHHYSLPRT